VSIVRVISLELCCDEDCIGGRLGLNAADHEVIRRGLTSVRGERPVTGSAVVGVNGDSLGGRLSKDGCRYPSNQRLKHES
jgi:hypothetical protein